MSEWPTMRVKVAVVLLCVSAVVYAVEICRRAHILEKRAPDAITLEEMRLSEVKKKLVTYGTVGYIADDSEGVEKDVAWRRFATTQYSLAPVLLDRSIEHELILGVFEDSNKIPTVANASGLLVVEQFGKGVVLFKKK
jgi:hypothetical protein